MCLRAGALIAVGHVNLAHQIKPRHRRVAVCRLNFAIERLISLCLVDHRVDLREWDIVLRCPPQRLFALRADQEWRAWPPPPPPPPRATPLTPPHLPP